MIIPKEVKNIIEKLEQAGFEAYAVGGCARDLLLGVKSKDWDITTRAEPEEIQKLFPDSFYENVFGTVGVKTGSKDKTLEIVEATTFRSETGYSDKRHPDKIEFAKTLEEDLKRRDFTINALALSVNNKLVDLFDGEKDLKQGVIRTVGVAYDRFNEDALRLMRAIRFATTLNFTIDGETFDAIKDNAKLIDVIAKERIRDEFIKILDSKNAYKGIILLNDAGLLNLILPELTKGIDVGQNKHHIYTVFEHNLYSLKWAAEHDYSLHVKIAALFHDIGKPQTKRGEGSDSTFYGHDVVSARITEKILTRLCFPKEFIKKATQLVRHHLFYYNVGEVTENAIRRLVARLGPENMDDLVKLRICDRMGSGVPKPEPYRLRHFRFMVEKVQKDPITVGMLKVSGNDVMKKLKTKPGPKVGQILAILLDEVLDDPSLNTKKHQIEQIKALGKKSEKELEKLKKQAIKKQEAVVKAQEEEIKRDYYIQ